MKLDAKAEKCILVGYSHAHKGYKCYNPETREVHVIHNVVFGKEALLRDKVNMGQIG